MDIPKAEVLGGKIGYLKIMSTALDEGRALGLTNDSIHQELGRERMAYVRPLTTRAPTSAQYDMLVMRLARCNEAEDL